MPPDEQIFQTNPPYFKKSKIIQVMINVLLAIND
jgi:hypothetical protein